MFDNFGQFIINVFALLGAVVTLLAIAGYLGARIMGAGDKPDDMIK